MKKAPENTTKTTNSNPLGFLARAMGLGSSGAIEQQESEGQRSFVESTTLPTNIDKDEKKILESWGVVFQGEVEGDPLFQYVTLPEGWKKVATDHSMHSSLLDDKGRKRAGIFYKAAFYDRRADLHLCSRYTYESDYDIDEATHRSRGCKANITDGGEVIHTTEFFPKDADKSWIAGDKAREAAKEWLDENYSKWRNKAAYWDE